MKLFTIGLLFLCGVSAQAQTLCMTTVNKDHNRGDNGEILVSQTYLKTYTSEEMKNFQSIKDLQIIGDGMMKFPKTRYHTYYMDNPTSPSIVVLESNAPQKDAAKVEDLIKKTFPIHTTLKPMYQRIDECKKINP